MPDLLLRAKTGDRSALGRLLESFRPLLRVAARESLDHRVQARVDESDLSQMTLWTAAEGFPAFCGQTEAELVGWLQAILAQHAAAIARQHLKTQKREAGRDVHLGGINTADSQAPAFDLAMSGPTPSRRIQQQELR